MGISFFNPALWSHGAGPGASSGRVSHPRGRGVVQNMECTGSGVPWAILGLELRVLEMARLPCQLMDIA